jgi:hypothetical protein
MENRRSSSSSPWERGFELSYKVACEQLAKISDIAQQCRRSSARYIRPNEIVVNYLNQPYRITITDCGIALEDSGTEASLRDKILILHYFTGAKGTVATGKLIAFRQLSGGISYFPAFSQRAIGPLVKNFGKGPELLRKVAAKLGGREAGYGDSSVTINAFDRVPITLVLWKGDEDVAANGNILFDANISDYLPTEDVTVLCETIIWKLVKNIPGS